MSATAKNSPQHFNILVPFETQNIPEDYREYYAAKRNNFFASIEGFPELWKYYLMLDKIWLREFEDLKFARDPERMFPLLVYINAHAKIRVSIELALSGCMAEARSILRDAVEHVAFAHKMVSNPELQKTWLKRNDNEDTLKAFEKAFIKDRRTGLFDGLEELHKSWGELSESGSHATAHAMCDRFVMVESDDTIELRINYCGVDRRMWGMSLFSMLLTCFTMERILFSDYETRLKLDDGLMRMRLEFEVYKEQQRKTLISRYGLKPPEPVSLIHMP